MSKSELGVKLKGLGTLENLKEHILKNGSGDSEENLRVFNSFYSNGPRYLLRALHKKYGILDLKMADVGSCYGNDLCYAAEGSYGIEIDVHDRLVDFCNSIGLTTYKRDIVEDDVLDLPKVDAVWNSAVMEHVDSPHIFLRKMWQLLKPNGYLFLFVPTMPLIPLSGKTPFFGKYFVGHKHGDHVNAFTAKTVQFTCERAGFETIENSPFYPGPLKIFNRFNIMDGTVYVGRKKANWEYPKKAARRKADNKNGFVFVNKYSKKPVK